MKFNEAKKNLNSELSEMRVTNEKRLNERKLSDNEIQEIVADLDPFKYKSFDYFLVAVGGAVGDAGGEEEDRDYGYNFARELHGDPDEDGTSIGFDDEYFD